MNDGKSENVTNDDCYEKTTFLWQQGNFEKLIELSVSRPWCKKNPISAMLIGAAYAQKGERDQALDICRNIDRAQISSSNKSLMIDLLLSGVHSNISEAFFLIEMESKCIKHNVLCLKLLNAHRHELKVAPALLEDTHKTKHKEKNSEGWCSLEDLYFNKTEGKISDKWQLYLRIYNELLLPYRELQITLLEIGIQNGGSLEVWQEFFPKAKKIIGCDINDKCNDLVYESKAIEVVTGDAKSFSTYNKVTSISHEFDIVFDDGSHDSIDCIKNFVRYFSHVKKGGVFIIEDVHCSYWKEFSGGLYHPLSIVSFFKDMLDVLNCEHWGVSLNIKDHLRKYSNVIEDEGFYQTLLDLHSIEFFNSVIVIKKQKKEMAGLGDRVVVGREGLITGDDYINNNGTTIKRRDQSNNTYSRK